MKNILLAILVACTITIAFGQKKETRKLSAFSELSVAEAISVELVKGNSEQAVIEISGTEPENVLTDVSGDRLKIHMERGNWHNVSVRILLTYREIDEIAISSAASVKSVSPLRSDNMELEVSSAGRGELTIETGHLEIHVSSAGKLDLNGKTGKLQAELSSSGHLDAFDLTCQDAEVQVSSAGSANINVAVSIDASASSGGHISYRGSPEKVYANSSSGGSIRKD